MEKGGIIFVRHHIGQGGAFTPDVAAPPLSCRVVWCIFRIERGRGMVVWHPPYVFSPLPSTTPCTRPLTRETERGLIG